MRTVAIVNQKGGVGKTTVCRTLSHMLAENNKRVLVIDVDPQQTLSLSLSVVKNRFDEQTPSMYHVLTGELPIEQAIINISDNLSIIRSDYRLYSYNGKPLISMEDVSAFDGDPTGLYNYIMNGYKNQLDPDSDDRHRIRRELSRISEYGFDYVIFDTSPDLGWLLTSVLLASPVVNVIIPAFAEESSREAILALNRSIKTILANDLSQKINILGVLISKYENNNLSKSYLKFMAQTANAMGTSLFNTIIPKSVAIPEAMALKMDLFDGRKVRVLDAYKDFYNEFLTRIENI